MSNKEKIAELTQKYIELVRAVAGKKDTEQLLENFAAIDNETFKIVRNKALSELNPTEKNCEKYKVQGLIKKTKSSAANVQTAPTDQAVGSDVTENDHKKQPAPTANNDDKSANNRKRSRLTPEQDKLLEDLKKRMAEKGIKVPEGDVSSAVFDIYYRNLKTILENHENGKNLDVNTLSDTVDEPNTQQPQQPQTWVERKIANYREMAESGKIAEFEPTPEAKDYFEAKVNGAIVRYDNKNSVKVSENANISVFEAILNEKDNLSRTINFAEGMPHGTAMRLLAACLLNGRAMSGSIPEFTEDDKQKLNSELGPERFAKLQNIIGNNENSSASNIKTIDSIDDIKKQNEELYKIREQFEKMRENSEIAIVSDMKTHKVDIVAGEAIKDKNEEEQKVYIDKAKKLFNDALAIVKAKKTLEGALTKEEQNHHNDFINHRLELLRSTLDQKKLAEKDKNKAAKRNKDPKMPAQIDNIVQQRKQNTQ